MLIAHTRLFRIFFLVPKGCRAAVKVFSPFRGCCHRRNLDYLRSDALDAKESKKKRRRRTWLVWTAAAADSNSSGGGLTYRGGWVGEKTSPSPALGWFDRFLEVRVTDQ